MEGVSHLRPFARGQKGEDWAVFGSSGIRDQREFLKKPTRKEWPRAETITQEVNSLHDKGGQGHTKGEKRRKLGNVKKTKKIELKSGGGRISV